MLHTYVTEPSNTLQKPSNYLKPPSIRARNSKLDFNVRNWFKKYLINLRNHTMIQNFEKFEIYENITGFEPFGGVNR